jgi:hypothetical protein
MESGLSDVFNSDLIQAWEDNGRLLTWFYQLAAGIAACPVLSYTSSGRADGSQVYLPLCVAVA